MQKTRRVLTVFLASPGDVAPERTAAEEVVAAVNKLTGPHLGWHIDLRKWEDTAPGFGRPQARINPLVDECDLFVGLLWEKWGHPSGAYSSGFEEEFERARARRRSKNEPDIWLVFKDVNRDKLEDPGDQLKKVIEFRSSQIALNEVLFKEVRDADDWKNKFRTWLEEHVFQLALPLQQQPASALPVLESPETSSIESASQTPGRPAIPEQLKALSAVLGHTLQTNALDFFDTDETPLQEFHVARLFLLSATLMFLRYTGEVVGTHTINVLYKHREQLEATIPEQFELLRAVIGNGGDVNPGWFWFRELNVETISNALVVLARGRPENVRARAVDLLAAAQIEIPQDLWPSLLRDDSFQVRQSAFNYLGARGDKSALSFLDGLDATADAALSATIQHARLQILTRLDPERAFSEMIAKDQYISDAELQSLLARISEVAEQTLLKGAKSPGEQVRKLSLEELMGRKRLPAKLAEQFTTDPSLVVRAIAFQSLAAQGALPSFDAVRNALKDTDEESNPKAARLLTGWKLMGGGGKAKKSSPDVDSIIVTFYRTQSVGDLLVAVDWFSSHGHLAYRALALDRFDTISTDLRSDLANGFERIREESSRRKEKEFGPEGWKKLAASWEELDEYIRSLFTGAALLGLAKNAQPSDVELVRPYLTHKDSSLRDAAVTVICKFGNAEDASALLKIAKEAYGDVTEEAARGALKLSSNPVGVARELMQSPRAEIVKIAFNWMLTQDSQEVKEFFEGLLHDEKSANRVRALRYFAKRLHGVELEDLLKQCIGQETYYYNVITWLDRLLYSPTPLRDVFVRDLEQIN